MKRPMLWALPVLALVLAGTWAWRRAATPSPATSAPAGAAAPAAARALELLPQDLWQARVQPLERGVEVTGALDAVHSAVVKAKVAGELKTLSVREGDAVRAGQVLGQIDTTEFDWRLRQAQQQAEAAKAQLDIAVRQLSNSQALVGQGFISPTALETATATEAGARANLQAAQAAVALAQKARADATLVAPIGGLVAQRLAQPGERVAVDGRVLEIVDLSALELEAAIPPQDVGLLRVGARAQLRVEGQPAPIAARVVRIGPSAVAGTRAVPAWLAVPAVPGLKQGLFARGWVELGRREALTVPLAAVRLDGARPYAVAVRDGVARSQVLGLGERGRGTDGTELVEVLSGLQAGDTVLAPSTGQVPDGTRLKLPAPAPAASGAAPAAAAAPAASAASAAAPAAPAASR